MYTKTKFLFKFGSLERLYVEMRSKKLFKLPDTREVQMYMYMYVHALTHVKAPYFAVRM